MSGFADQASEYWAQGQEQMQECIRGREATAVFMAVAAGLGMGLVWVRPLDDLTAGSVRGGIASRQKVLAAD